MVSAKAILYKNKNTKPLMETTPDESPIAIQLFGSDPGIMADIAAQVAEETSFDIIDVNMGCPVPKIVGNHEGSALMKEPKLVEAILTAMVKKLKKPLTIKIRKGFNDESVNAVEIAKIAEACGVSAVAVHGRTREEYYSGVADYDIIAQVKKAVSIPIFTAQLEKSREATDKANIRSAYVEVMTAALTDTGSTHDTTLDVNREGTDGAYVCSSYLALPSALPCQNSVYDLFFILNCHCLLKCTSETIHPQANMCSPENSPT
jgi:nifR3 family TIM-barrel protein